MENLRNHRLRPPVPPESGTRPPFASTPGGELNCPLSRFLAHGSFRGITNGQVTGIARALRGNAAQSPRPETRAPAAETRASVSSGRNAADAGRPRGT
jgi:hypothetical protein